MAANSHTHTKSAGVRRYHAVTNTDGDIELRPALGVMVGARWTPVSQCAVALEAVVVVCPVADHSVCLRERLERC